MRKNKKIILIAKVTEREENFMSREKMHEMSDCCLQKKSCDGDGMYFKRILSVEGIKNDVKTVSAPLI